MFNDIFDELNNVFGEISKNSKEAMKNVKNYISVNAIENEEAYLVEAAIPGVNKNDISISYNDGKLDIEVKATNETEEKKYLVRERTNNFYKRSINLPGVDMQAIKAKYENGILSVVLGKEKKETKNISID